MCWELIWSLVLLVSKFLYNKWLSDLCGFIFGNSVFRGNGERFFDGIGNY